MLRVASTPTRLAPSLGVHPDVTGVLFELPQVAAHVAPTSRLQVAAGDFFADRLPRCDAYVLMNIVHDWEDADAVAILTAVATSGRHGATVLVVEAVLPDGSERHLAKTLDVVMLTSDRRPRAHLRRVGPPARRGRHRFGADAPHNDSVSIMEGRVR